MSEKDALHGLSCPRCGGMVPVPEGQAIVVCPFCDLRSVVKGERGVRRYQVPCQVKREQAVAAYQKFLKGSLAISGDAQRSAQLSEVILVHLPFWAAWGRGLAWTFGREKVRQGDEVRWKTREVRVVREMNWTGAACDVGEFGVSEVNLTGRPLHPFASEDLHHSGMVFEPVGSAEEAFAIARQEFEAQVRSKAELDEISQSFVKIIRPFLAVVYYPLWVIRYNYKERSFQVVVDGFSGEVLYGKAPGNVYYRAAVLVGGMGFGAFLAIDVSALVLSAKSGEDNLLIGAVIAFAIGLGIMYGAFRTFRYGEHYEYKRYGSKSGASQLIPTNASQVIKAVRNLEKFR